jgi:cytochrome bd-type quinol oxidase subunit 1
MRIVRSARNAVLMSLILCVLLPQTALALLSIDISQPFASVICALYISFKYAVPALGVMIFVVAGALWVYSQDDAGKRNAAKVWITHVIIGAIIAVVAWVVAASIVPTGWVLYTCT